MTLTPMMQQYMQVKENYQDCILFYRLGDFYEMFFEDALTGARELEITLTARNCGLPEKAPMCGVPHHARDNYIAKLIEKGYKVAVCEQTESPGDTKGIVKREVTQIVTPGTIVSQSMLSEKENNYLACIYFGEHGVGMAYCDISTGEIKATEITGPLHDERVVNETVKIMPREILLSDTLVSLGSGRTEDFLKEIKLITNAFCAVKNEAYFSTDAAESAILNQFQVKALTGIGLADKPDAVRALGALLSYLLETQKHSLAHVSCIQVYDSGAHMSMDKSTIRNLELTETLFEKKVQGSLLGVLDKTQTAMGSRKIKRWIREPLHEISEIQDRLDAVECLFDQVLLRNNIRESLKHIYDLERLSGRIACGSANGRDLIALRNSIACLPEIRAELAEVDSALLSRLCEQIDELSGVRERIEKAVKEEPPYTIKDGGIIQDGYSPELDEIKQSIIEKQRWIAGLEAAEKERTGIRSIKVGYTKIFGYYIEVTKSYYDQVPENYIRKQTLANCERYVTQELKEAERLVLNAEAKINQMEYEIFLELRQFIQGFISGIQQTSSAVAGLDVLCSFAETAAKLDYVKPTMETSDRIEIEKGRHPVIELAIKDGIFVSNDTFIDTDRCSMLLITGPNMAGKSTYMRQTALIVLMAQIGCFVPAARARIGVVDKIFTRIGSSDNLAQGQSTFFVEMSELAYILNTATSKSLIILDEIGRGTSTYDGLSIAWAAVEYLCKQQKRIRTLFATHYHELTSLHRKGIQNLNVDVQDQNGNIIFLHKIIAGSASRSYGIHVARLAGVPEVVLQMAEEKLDEMERKDTDIFPAGTQNTSGEIGAGMQLSFFDQAHPALEKLRKVNLMDTTPLQAFAILEELKALARGET